MGKTVTPAAVRMPESPGCDFPLFLHWLPSETCHDAQKTRFLKDS